MICDLPRQLIIHSPSTGYSNVYYLPIVSLLFTALTLCIAILFAIFALIGAFILFSTPRSAK